MADLAELPSSMPSMSGNSSSSSEGSSSEGESEKQGVGADKPCAKASLDVATNSQVETEHKDKARPDSGHLTHATGPNAIKKHLTSNTNKSKNKSKSKGMNIVTEVQPGDILFGRGQPFQTHPGNKRLHDMVDACKSEYKNSMREGKRRIAQTIVEHIQDVHHGRFLKPHDVAAIGECGNMLSSVPRKKCWVEVSGEEAQNKVRHTIRSRLGDSDEVKMAKIAATATARTCVTVSGRTMSAAVMENNLRRRSGMTAGMKPMKKRDLSSMILAGQMMRRSSSSPSPALPMSQSASLPASPPQVPNLRTLSATMVADDEWSPATKKRKMMMGLGLGPVSMSRSSRERETLTLVSPDRESDRNQDRRHGDHSLAYHRRLSMMSMSSRSHHQRRQLEYLRRRSLSMTKGMTMSKPIGDEGSSSSSSSSTAALLSTPSQRQSSPSAAVHRDVPVFVDAPMPPLYNRGEVLDVECTETKGRGVSMPCVDRSSRGMHASMSSPLGNRGRSGAAIGGVVGGFTQTSSSSGNNTASLAMSCFRSSPSPPLPLSSSYPPLRPRRSSMISQSQSHSYQPALSSSYQSPMVMTHEERALRARVAELQAEREAAAIMMVRRSSMM